MPALLDSSTDLPVKGETVSLLSKEGKLRVQGWCPAHMQPHDGKRCTENKLERRTWRAVAAANASALFGSARRLHVTEYGVPWFNMAQPKPGHFAAWQWLWDDAQGGLLDAMNTVGHVLTGLARGDRYGSLLHHQQRRATPIMTVTMILPYSRWGSLPLPQHRLSAEQTYTWAFAIQPYDAQGDGDPTEIATALRHSLRCEH